MHDDSVVSRIVSAPTSTSSSWIAGIMRWLFEVSKLFWQPTNFLKQRAVKPTIFMPYLLVLIFSFIFTAMTVDVHFREWFAQKQGIDITQIDSVSPLALAGSAFLRFLVVSIAPLAFVLCVWIWSNVLKLRRVSAQELLSVLSIVLYGEVIYHLGSFIRMAMILIKQTTYVSVSLGIAALELGCDPKGAAYQLINKLDVFLIWEIIVIGIGLSILYGCSRKKALLLSALSIEIIPVLWILW